MLSYLRRRGYQWTEEQLRAIKASAATAGLQRGGGGGGGATASGASSAIAASLEESLGEAAMDLQLELHSSLLHSLLTAHPRVTSPEHFEHGYSALRTFMLGLVDVYAAELKLVLWPLFLHSFLGLFLRGCPADALTFYGRHRRDHEAGHHAELLLLAQIQQEGHVHKSDYTKFALQRKMEISVTRSEDAALARHLRIPGRLSPSPLYPIPLPMSSAAGQMSAFCYDLLLSVIERRGLVLVLQLLTEHVHIKGPPLSRRAAVARLQPPQRRLLTARHLPTSVVCCASVGERSRRSPASASLVASAAAPLPSLTAAAPSPSPPPVRCCPVGRGGRSSRPSRRRRWRRASAPPLLRCPPAVGWRSGGAPCPTWSPCTCRPARSSARA